MFYQKCSRRISFFPSLRKFLSVLVVFLASGNGRLLAWQTTDTATATWTFRGPQPIASTSSVTSGRVIALAVDPRNSLTVYAGSGGGGIWKSTDGGMNWNSVTDHVPFSVAKHLPRSVDQNLLVTQAALAVGAIAIDPVHPDIVYAGTGEINACEDCYPGGGILKSEDAGQTWKRITGPFVDALGRGARIGALAVNAGNDQIVLAAAFFLGANGIPGVYRSPDGGATWQNVLNIGQGTAVAFDPINTNVAYAGVYGGGLYKSIDAGLTWRRLTIGDDGVDTPANVGRVDFALAPSAPANLYAAFADVSPGSSGGTLGLFGSTDGGDSWRLLSGASNYCTTTCGYNSVLAVDPGDPGTVFLGGVDLQRSMDGGQTWQDLTRGITTIFPPSGQHALAIPAGNSALYTGNDGGVNGAPVRTDPALAWVNLNPTLAISELTARVSIDPANPNRSFGGVQKSGIELFGGTADWRTVACQDAGAVIVNQSEPSTAYASCSQVGIYQSTNSGSTWLSQIGGLDQSDRTDSTPPLVNDITRPERLYFGTYRVYRSDDGGGAWGAISPALADGNATVTSIAVSANNPDVAYAGTSDGRIYVTSNATQTGTAWTERTNGLPKRAIRQIAVDYSNPFIAYLAVSGFAEAGDVQGHVFQTLDSGVTWNDVSGDLPNVPVNDILIDPDLPATWYVATDAGVFVSVDSGAYWNSCGTGLPNVVVRGLTLHRPSRILRASTHGRGVWDLSVPLAGGVNVNPGLGSVSPNQSPISPVQLTITAQGFGFVPGATVQWNGLDRPTAFVSSTQLTATLSGADLAASSLSMITVLNPGPGGGASNALPFTVAPSPVIAANGIVDAASYNNRPLTPGSIATLTGTNLALLTTAANTYPLPTVLGGTSVHVAFTEAPLTYVSPTSISFQVPWELAGETAAIVQVQVGEVIGPAQSVVLGEFNPGIFTLDQSGTGQGYITIANENISAQPVGSSPGARPARPGEVIAIFCSGLGSVTNTPPDGVQSPDNPFAPTMETPSVTIGGQPAQITFNALAPGLVGVYVVNAIVPQGTADSDVVPVVIGIAGLSSNTVTLAVQAESNVP